MKKWEELPKEFQNKEVEYYYTILYAKKRDLLIKRMFDIIVAGILLVLLCPVILLIAIAIKIDSKGSAVFSQTRVTSLGKKFRIFKFRTMVENAEALGTKVTVQGDSRITKVGRILRKYRMDELLQLINVLKGDMTFVGTRPEVEKYVRHYTNEMKATLLLPAGITSLASIKYKDEDKLLRNAQNIDEVYITQILPEKMKYNLKAIEDFSFWSDIKTMFQTVAAVIK